MEPKSRYCSQEELDDMLSDEKAAFLLFDGGSLNIQETKEEISKSAIFAELNLFLLREQMKEEKAPSEWNDSGTFFADVKSFQLGTYDDTTERCEWSKEATKALLKAYQRQSEERKKDGHIRLNHHAWEIIVNEVNASEITGMLKTMKQCRDKLSTLLSNISRKSCSSNVISARY